MNDAKTARPPWRHAALAMLVFLPFVAFHTVYHEAAHWAVGRAGGFQSTLHYSAVNGEDGDPRQLRYDALLEEHARSGNEAFPDDAEFLDLHRHSVAATAAGPISTMLVGTAGLFWLIRRRRGRPRSAPLHPSGWVATFLALAWGRQAMWLIPTLPMLILGIEPANGGRSVDEGRVAWGLGLSPELVLLLVGSLGSAICLAIIVRLHPQGRRWYFVLGAASGIVLGGILWFGLLGPWLLP